jgi:hypothetical protein
MGQVPIRILEDYRNKNDQREDWMQPAGENPEGRAESQVAQAEVSEKSPVWEGNEERERNVKNVVDDDGQRPTFARPLGRGGS